MALVATSLLSGSVSVADDSPSSLPQLWQPRGKNWWCFGVTFQSGDTSSSCLRVRKDCERLRRSGLAEAKKLGAVMSACSVTPQAFCFIKKTPQNFRFSSCYESRYDCQTGETQKGHKRLTACHLVRARIVTSPAPTGIPTGNGWWCEDTVGGCRRSKPKCEEESQTACVRRSKAYCFSGANGFVCASDKWSCDSIASIRELNGRPQSACRRFR